MQIAPQVAFAQLVVVASAAGCLQPTYNYIDVPLPPAQARAQLLTENEALGLHVYARPCPVVVCDREDAIATTPILMNPERDRWYSYNIGPHGDGSRVEIIARGSAAPELPPLLASQPVTTVVPEPGEPGWSDVIVHDFELSGGITADPRGASWRTNFVGQVGARLHRFGTDSDLPHPGYSASLLFGGGVELSGDGPALLVQTTLSFDRQRMVEPIPGEHLPMGPRAALDLSFAGVLFSEDPATTDVDIRRRNGIEAGVGLRIVNYGGVTARIGRMWGDGRGTTAFLGVRVLNPMHAVIVAGAIAVIAGIAEAITHAPSVMVSGG